MGTMKRRFLLLFLSIGSILIVLSACGSSNEESEGEIILQNEQGEDVTLTNKERATVLFHFTEVG